MSDPHLAFERERNRDYLRVLGSTNTIRIKGVDPRRLSSDWGPLLGRVSLTPTARDDQQFYVGPRPAVLPDGTRVVSWVAPAASILFSSARSWRDQEVRVKRRFKTDATDVRGYADQWLIPQDGDPFPVTRRPIARPPSAAPGAVGQEARDRRRVTEAEIADRAAQRKRDALAALHERKLERNLQGNDRQRGETTPAPSARRRTAPASPAPNNSQPAVGGASEDAGDFVREAMSQPRRTELPSVLATMSPEQYAAVTADPNLPALFTGHPGTGKTIIATHRLAWITHPDRHGSADYALLVGPTDAWAESVRPSVAELTDPAAVQVRSLPGLMRFFLEAKSIGKPRPEQHEDTSQELADALAAYTEGDFSAPLSEAYTVLRIVGFGDESDELRRWRKSLPPSLDQAMETIPLRPMLTYLKIRAERFTKFSHVIVDEAQDLRPLEWEILRLLNGGSWTILGDLHQRRTLFSDSSWAQIGQRIGHELSGVELTQGYRSTQAIMKYAGALLDDRAGGRTSSVLGEGEPPKVIDAKTLGRSAEHVALSEVTRIRRLIESEATVAVITTDVRKLQLAAESSGWQRAGNRAGVGTYARTIDDSTATTLVLTPERARGLEFDAVVVVEPALFTHVRAGIRVSGQYRTLYTSLTRANRLLSIVHERPLPAPLGNA